MSSHIGTLNEQQLAEFYLRHAIRWAKLYQRLSRFQYAKRRRARREFVVCFRMAGIFKYGDAFINRIGRSC